MYNEIKSIKEPTEEDCYLGIIRVYQREVGNLQQENKQLKEDKKKAREFIEKNFIRFKDSENGLVLNELSLINIEEIKNLLEILGDKENE